MELYDMKVSIAKNLAKLESIGKSLDLEGKRKLIAENNAEMAHPDFWNDQKKAQKLIRDNNQMKALVESHDSLMDELTDLSASVADLSKTYDQDMNDLVQEEYTETMKKFEEFEIQVLLSGPYDDHNAILEIHPGAGGTEAMDWAGMLYRMYMRWVERRGFKATILDYEEGEEAGMRPETKQQGGRKCPRLTFVEGKVSDIQTCFFFDLTLNCIFDGFPNLRKAGN